MENLLSNQRSQYAVEVEDIVKSFRGRLALDSVSFSAEEGEMLALVGASGSGKSTLLRNINGLHQADRGTIRILGNVLQSNGQFHSHIRQLRGQIGFIFQQFNLVNRLTVLENVLVGNLANISLIRSLLKQFSKAEKIEALCALERVGILEQAHKRASMLSGGQQQRVAIARCLMQGANIILADEPIASLDPESARKVMELLTTLNQEQGITVIASLHQVQIVQRYFKRSVALQQGKICFDGLTKDLGTSQLAEIYGGATEELVLRGHGEVFSN
ncbi:phosphonate ABC transporter ATP-binding protein [Leptolyngbya cf. ectocarpi LEGE 11479]|uniref:Phosphonate ABC transporter ATP-binding protein n=1 Tax=Leptolyngbya cf. ectocarpi LEGE 11479 TaxID=1828722 RepID=A0A928ZY33_LEPEC|nr:phosphonate ABC transporter ATP-binding protein [Leptolyngbya ectocarpi]MBE9069584.1 phosphonate ABC transporter ATP-binding protein [Leptolyngbya cf. ectocarpi LEGE 11479]